MFRQFEYRIFVLAGLGSLVISQIAIAQSNLTASAVPPASAQASASKPILCADAIELGQADPALQRAIDGRDRLAREIRDMRMARLGAVQKAIQGDAAARRQVAQDWYDCIDEQRPMSDEQKRTAVEWLEDAAKKGDRKAAYSLGIMFAKGMGVTQSYNEAYKWYVLSDERLVSNATSMQASAGFTADQAERQAAYHETLRSLVPRDSFLFLTPQENRKLFGQPAAAMSFSGTLGFEDCSEHVDIQAQPPIEQTRIDRAQQRLSKLFSKLPLIGVACQDKNGQPVRWQLPYAARKPAN